MRFLFILLILQLLITACSPIGDSQSGNGQGASSPPIVNPTPIPGPENVTAVYKNPVIMQVSWTRPYCNTDNSELRLEDIGGLNLHYGYTRNIYEVPFEIADNEATAFAISLNKDGVYYFTLDVFSTQNRQSDKALPVEVTCANSSCVATDVPESIPDDDCPFPAANSNNKLSSTPFISFYTPTEYVKLRNNKLNKRVYGRATCPGLPLLEPKKEIAEYSIPHTRVSKPSSREFNNTFIQCYDHDVSNLNLRHKIGYKKVKLHTAAIRAGKAFIKYNAIYIPADISQLSAEHKLEIATDLGANPRQIKISDAFIELPYSLNSTFLHSSHHHNKDYALINSTIKARATMNYIRLCKDNKKSENCIQKLEVLSSNLTYSPYFLKYLEKDRVSTLRLAFDKNEDLTAILETLNAEGVKIQLFQKERNSENKNTFNEILF